MKFGLYCCCGLENPGRLTLAKVKPKVLRQTNRLADTPCCRRIVFDRLGAIVSGEFVSKRLAEMAHHVHHHCVLCRLMGGVVITPKVCCENWALVVPKRRYVLPAIPWFDKRVA
jgi:hypothetical protein